MSETTPPVQKVKLPPERDDAAGAEKNRRPRSRLFNQVQAGKNPAFFPATKVQGLPLPKEA